MAVGVLNGSGDLLHDASLEDDKLTLQVMDLRGTPEGRQTNRAQSIFQGLGQFLTLSDKQNLVELLASKKADRYFRRAVVFTRMKEQPQPLAATEPRSSF